MTGALSPVVLELLISPNVALLMMLLLSNGLWAAGGLAAAPERPKESIDPIRFWRALSAMDPAASFWIGTPERRPSEVRLFMVRTALDPLAVGVGAWWVGETGAGAMAGGWGENGSAATGAGAG